MENDDSSRRKFLKTSGAVLATGAMAGCLPGIHTPVKTTPFQPGNQYRVIVIGTGFGASVASTLFTQADPNLQMLIIERGSFWFSPERPLPKYLEGRNDVQYWPRPDNMKGFLDFLSLVTLQEPGQTGTSYPLYSYRRFDTIDILTANGVGGGSLVYSNVSLRPTLDGMEYPVMKNWASRLTPADYDNAEGWMKTWRGAPSKVVTTIPLSPDLRPFVDDLSQVKDTDENGKPYPHKAGNYEYLYLRRSQKLRQASKILMNGKWRDSLRPWAPLPLQVVEHVGADPADFATNTRFCERQGRCFLGCLPGARHTLNKTLIDKVLNKPNVRLRPLTKVLLIQKAPDGNMYDVIHQDLVSGNTETSRAEVVIIGAGVLGSTELLLRCKSGTDGPALPLSQTLGSHFSTNGDFSGFVKGIPKDMPDPQDPAKRIDNRVFPTKGPINTCHVGFKEGDLQITFEDAGIPPMFAELTQSLIGRPNDFLQLIQQVWKNKLFPQQTNPLAHQTEHEMVEDIFWFNCMGTDGAKGTFRLDGFGNLALDYPGITSEPVFGKMQEVMRDFATAMQGSYVPFPLFNGLKPKIVTTHPLGGCPLGANSSDGTVDSLGRVFNTESGNSSVHPGLYVMDGSVMPGPLAVNPTLSIVALALRSAKSALEYLKLSTT